MTRMMFEQELKSLRVSLEEMGRYVEYAMNKLSEAIINQDKELAEFIIKNDRNVNDMEKAIEAKCLSLITKQHPIASDLRMVSSALKVVTDLERIGDNTADIAELVIRNIDIEIPQYSIHLMPMIQEAKKMVQESIEHFINRNLEESKNVIEYDDVVDELFNKVKIDVINALKTTEDQVDVCIDILMISKYLEKIGDHAVNIAQWEVFRETGNMDDVRLL